MTDIAARRLHAQRLIGEPLPLAVDVVRLLGAVQAQDFSGAAWAVGQRTARTTQAEIDRLFDDGAILRTHVLRPTWHFVLPEDIRWLLDLTGPRIRRGLAGRYRQLGIDEGEVARAMSSLRDALAGGRFLTRQELGRVLQSAGISPEGQRLPHFLMTAELAGAVTSGPRRGKQFTYALLEERAPGSRTLPRDEALVELTRRYFRSHGPAQLGDFVWWSGLSVADARAGIALAAQELRYEAVEGKEYVFHLDTDLEGPATAAAHLLPNWDEYTVGYRDRGEAMPPDDVFDPSVFSFGSILSNVVTTTGRVRGAWRRTIGPGSIRVELRLLGRLDSDEIAAVEAAGRRLGRFIEAPIELTWRYMAP